MRRFRSEWLPPILASLVVLAITEWPYAAARRAAAPDQVFDGLIAYPGEIHAYLSFVRQAAEGRWLFENRYAPESHAPVFFNLEWLLAGWATRWLGDEEALVLWRGAGVVVLTFGFWRLSAKMLRGSDRALALAVFCLGGGSGWLFRAVATCGFLGPISPEFLALLHVDLVWGVHPFVQMLQNPHFSFPHGLVLLSLGALIAAEETARTSLYAAAGALAFCACASRPYEIAAFIALVALLHVSSGAVTDLRRFAQRVLFLLVLSPAAVSPLVLLWHPSFRTWSAQGVLPPLPLLGYLILMGLPALALGLRIARERRLPWGTPAERVLLLWAATVVLLAQAGQISSKLGYSGQVVITCMGPLVLLSLPLLTGGHDHARSPRRRFWTAVAVVAISLPSSAVLLSERAREAPTDPALFVTKGESLAWSWLAREVAPSDLILTSVVSGNRIPRHVGAHVLPGQWALTPQYARRVGEAEAFFSGMLAPEAAGAYLQGLGVDWLWVGPRERALGGWGSAGFAPGCVTRYKHLGVRIYRCGGG
jgi:hypothetical protein